MATDTTNWLASLQKNANGWNGAAIAPVALSGVRLTSDAMVAVVPESADDGAIGDLFVAETYTTRTRGTGGIGDMLARYEGLERVIAWALGADVQAVDGDKNKHTMLPTGVLTATQIFQYVIDKNEGDPWIWDSNFMTGFELKLSDGLVVVTPSVITSTLKRAVLTFAAHSLPTEAFAINLNEAVLRMNDSSGAALAAGDAIKFSDFTFSFNRSMEGDPVNNVDGSDDEPQTTGFPECTFSVTGPSLNADLDAILKQGILITDGQPTYQKADLVFTGPANGTAVRDLIIEMPRMKIMNPEALGVGPHQKVPVKIEFQCYRAATAPAGMFVGAPCRLEVGGSDNAVIPWA